MNNRLIASIAVAVIVVGAIVGYTLVSQRTGKVEMSGTPPAGRCRDLQ